MNRMLLVHGALFTVACIYSLNYVIAKFVTPEFVKPFGVIVLRVVGASILFTIIHRVSIREKIQNRKDYFLLFICSIFGVILNQLLFFKGLSLTTPIHMSIIMTSSPILILSISALVLKEKITGLKLLGMLLGGLGAFFLIGGLDFSFATETALGDILILLNASSYGVYLILVKPLMRRYHSLTVVKWVFLFGCIGVIPVGLPELLEVQWQEVPEYALWILVYIVVGVTFVAYLFNAWGLQYVNASVVGFYIYLQPFLTSLIAVTMGQEELTWLKVFMGLLILFGVFLVSQPDYRRKPKTT